MSDLLTMAEKNKNKNANENTRVEYFLQQLVMLLAFGSVAASASGGEPAFRVVPVNEQAEYAACAIFDVNGDGKLDILSGGWWYELPDFKRHFVRDVAQIRGRFDDYSNLPLDVDEDGWTDVVSCNYRSETLYWVRNPGAANEQPWQRMVIAQPGPMETGRLVDINGDGQLDVLPNGAQFAGWWERTSAVPVQWTRHALPLQLAGHGIGAGDINGDGRTDIIGSQGLAVALEDGTWQVTSELRLHSDASIPILVHDVDADGDNDIIYGRGHNIGLYWLEQNAAARDGNAAQRSWTTHVIDTSWSQAHSLLLADIDGDQRADLIAGKRYMGHDGRDIGEYDPLAIYWYRFDANTRSWQRGTISDDPRVGFGLDPKAVDVDGDGDVDVVTADRSGLYYCENLGEQTGAVNSTAPPSSLRIADHQHLLEAKDENGNPQQLTEPAEWALRRQLILAGMQQAMGPLPDAQRRVPLDVQVHEETDAGAYRRQRISYAAEAGDRVPAFLLIPKNFSGAAPAMLCLHQTTGIGKEEPAGIGGLENLHYAHELAELGFVCLVPDYPSFGEYPFDFAAVTQQYPSGSLKAIWNNIRGIDLLETLPEVNPDRIGCIGHSLGGHNSLFTAAFDQRIRAVVTSCGFTAFHQYYGGDLAGWTSDRYMPRIRDLYANDPDRMPFDFYEVLAAIAPRAVFVCAPLSDDNFDVTGVRKVEQEVAKVYDLLGVKDRVQYVYPDSAHDFPDQSRQEAYRFLQRQLQP